MSRRFGGDISAEVPVPIGKVKIAAYVKITGRLDINSDGVDPQRDHYW